MKRAVIFFNGDLSDVSRAKTHIKQTDVIIAADGGTEFVLKLGLMPHVIIGDNDSLSRQIKMKPADIEWVTFQQEKDATDSELALNYAVEKGFKQLVVFGLLGSRIDHFLSNIFALSFLDKKDISVMLIEGNQEIQVIHDSVTLKGNPGDIVSLLPLKGDVTGVSTKNLQYSLNKEKLHFSYSRGVSNVMTKKTAMVSLEKGLLLVIHTLT